MIGKSVWLIGMLSTSFVVRAKTLGCDGLLNSKYARRAQATAAAIIESDEDESDAYGYVGISDAELLSLLNTGRLRTPHAIRITTDHPAFAKVKIAPVDWRSAVRRSVQDARVRSTIDVLRSRASAETTAQNLDPQLLRVILSHLPPAAESGTFTPTAAQITAALTHVERTGAVANPFDPRDNLAEWLPVLRDLPAGAGARLVLSDRVMHRLTFAKGEWMVSSINLGDVVAIQPHSTATNDLLDILTERVRAAVRPATKRGT